MHRLARRAVGGVLADGEEEKEGEDRNASSFFGVPGPCAIPGEVGPDGAKEDAGRGERSGGDGKASCGSGQRMSLGRVEGRYGALEGKAKGQGAEKKCEEVAEGDGKGVCGEEESQIRVGGAFEKDRNEHRREGKRNKDGSPKRGAKRPPKSAVELLEFAGNGSHVAKLMDGLLKGAIGREALLQFGFDELAKVDFQFFAGDGSQVRAQRFAPLG